MNEHGSPKGVVFQSLEPEDGPRLKELYDRTHGLEDVFEAVGEADAQSTYVALPENKTYDDKYLVGVWLNTELVGVADAIMAHPQLDHATCGLLLIDARQRGKGLGSDLLANIEHAARRREVATLTVVVQARNQSGIAFLRKRGYQETSSLVEGTTARYGKNL